jgi:hypothetical protein
LTDCNYQAVLNNVLKGKWVVKANYKSEKRIASFKAINSDFFKTKNANRYCVIDKGIAVDSGQAGIFDEKYYKNDEVVKGVERFYDQIICGDDLWYSICCDRTLSKNSYGVIPYGAVSSSGYGDGFYEAIAGYDIDNNVVSIELIFIEDEDEDEDEDEGVYSGEVDFPINYEDREDKEEIDDYYDEDRKYFF